MERSGHPDEGMPGAESASQQTIGEENQEREALD